MSEIFSFLPGIFDFNLRLTFRAELILKQFFFLSLISFKGVFTVCFSLVFVFKICFSGTLLFAFGSHLGGAIWGRPWHPSYICTITSSNHQHYCYAQWLITHNLFISINSSSEVFVLLTSRECQGTHSVGNLPLPPRTIIQDMYSWLGLTTLSTQGFRDQGVSNPGG